MKKSLKRVIINADDFGITKGVNNSIFEYVDSGVLTSTSVMSNMKYYKDILKIKDEIGVGVHFNLTTGKSVTDTDMVKTLVNKNGDFFELSELLKRIKIVIFPKNETMTELNSQIKQLIHIGIQPDHIDSHESILKYPFFMTIMKDLAKKYGIMAVRTYTPRKFDYRRLLKPRKTLISLYLAYQKKLWKRERFRVADKYDSLLQLGQDYSTAIDKLRLIFRGLPDGVLEIGVHPGYCDEDSILLGGYVSEKQN